MSSPSQYKYCFVHYCTNTTVTTPDKIFVTVPKNVTRRKKWFEAARRIFDFSNTGNYYCCEDHFELKEDMENYMEYNLMGGKIFLKKTVVPHIFNWPESTLTESTYVYCEPSCSKQIIDKKIEVEIQCTPETTSKSQQTEIKTKNVLVSCDIKPQHHVKLDTSSLIFKSDIATSPPKKKRKIHVDEIVEEVSESVPSSSDYVPPSDTSETNKTIKNELCNCVLNNIEKYPKRYVGIPKVWYPIIIKLLCDKGNFKKEHILLCLMKIKLNDSFARLSDQFSVTIGGASKIFSNNVYKLDSYLSTFIYWPEKEVIKKNLPIPFRASYSEVQSIIDCLEIEIEKPSNPVHQALSWSQYKKCNTIKYLVSCTPDGFINFISNGYGGRISDTLLIQESEYLKVLPEGSVVMADRGFKEVSLILQRNNCQLLRPPSVSSTLKPTKEEVLETKRIASLRIHVERLIRRLREFVFLKGHSVVDHNLISYCDVIIRIACALTNLQSPLIK